MSEQTNPTVTEPLAPIEAALIRASEAEYQRVVAEAQAKRRDAAVLVLQAHQVPPDVTQWTITTVAGSLALVYAKAQPVAEMTSAGEVERTPALVKDEAAGS